LNREKSVNRNTPAGAPFRTEIEEIVRRIVERFDPERIILFGSHARGTAGPDSDVDLLVVKQVDGSRRQLATEMDLALWGLPVPADIIVVNPDEYERDRDQIGTIVHPAHAGGRVLFERGK
jgi:predicted nucleotidyltransferase